MIYIIWLNSNSDIMCHHHGYGNPQAFSIFNEPWSRWSSNIPPAMKVLTSEDGQGGPFTALRTFRLFRVLNKLASRWPSFRVLLKAGFGGEIE